MPQPNKIPLAFAASGDKNTIPESTETTGLASWRDGFPAITSVPFSEGGIAPKRADFNGIFNALSQAVMWMQQGGVYAYDVNTDYEAGNVVLDAGGLYVANSANGPSSVVVQPSSDTTGATWKLVRLDLATQSASGYMSKEDKALLDNVPTTYLPRSGGTLTGVTNAPTPATSDNSTKIATTSFVNNFAQDKMVRYIQINTDASLSFNMVGGSAVVIAKRNLYCAVLVFDEWNSAPVFVAEQLGAAPRPITGSQTSGKITLTNNGGYGALKLIILAGESV